MGDPLGSYVPPPGSAVHGSAHRVDPRWAAPRYAFAALLGALALGVGLAMLDGSHAGRSFGPPLNTGELPGQVVDALSSIRRVRARPFFILSLGVSIAFLGVAKRSFGLDAISAGAGAVLGIGPLLPLGVALRYLGLPAWLVLGGGSAAAGLGLAAALAMARSAAGARQLAGYAIWAAQSLTLVSLAWWRLYYESPPTSFGEGALPYLGFSVAAGVTFVGGAYLTWSASAQPSAARALS